MSLENFIQYILNETNEQYIRQLEIELAELLTKKGKLFSKLSDPTLRNWTQTMPYTKDREIFNDMSDIQRQIGRVRVALRMAKKGDGFSLSKEKEDVFKRRSLPTSEEYVKVREEEIATLEKELAELRLKYDDKVRRTQPYSKDREFYGNEIAPRVSRIAKLKAQIRNEKTGKRAAFLKSKGIKEIKKDIFKSQPKGSNETEEDFESSVADAKREDNMPNDGDKVKIIPSRVRGKHPKAGKVGTFIKLTPNSRSMGGNSRGDIAVIKWDDNTTTKEVYWSLGKVN